MFITLTVFEGLGSTAITRFNVNDIKRYSPLSITKGSRVYVGFDSWMQVQETPEEIDELIWKRHEALYGSRR